MTERRFDGKTAIVTGSGQGMGAAFAELLAARGANVVINDIDENGDGTSKAEAQSKRIQERGGNAVFCTESVATIEGARAIVACAMDHFDRIDIVIHNAGTTGYAAFDEVTLSDLQAQIAVHAIGAFGIFQSAWPHMKDRRYGRLLAITSGSGYYGHKFQAHYAMAKAAQIGLVRVLAAEGACHGISANALGVGGYTRMLHDVFAHDSATIEWWKCNMTPEVVASAAAWLCHEDCQRTGEIYQAVGPRMARVFMGETTGFAKPGLSLEEVADAFDAVNDTKEFTLFEGGNAIEMARNNVQILVEAGVPVPPPPRPASDPNNPFYVEKKMLPPSLAN